MYSKQKLLVEYKMHKNVLLATFQTITRFMKKAQDWIYLR